MKAMLLRIGIDKGTDGALGPIFEDGSFEYIPISESHQSIEDRTYRNTRGRKGQPISMYLPKEIGNRIMHFDPEFETFTYGDPTSKRRYLLKLKKDDLLVFYAGLTPFRNDKYKEALYVIGFFTIKDVIDFNRLSKPKMESCCQLYINNAHIKRTCYPENLVVVAGDKHRSRLLDKAILISQTRYNKIGRPYQVVSREMEASLGISGSIQRSIPPRFMRNNENLDNLKRILGLQE